MNVISPLGPAYSLTMFVLLVMDKDRVVVSYTIGLIMFELLEPPVISNASPIFVHFVANVGRTLLFHALCPEKLAPPVKSNASPLFASNIASKCRTPIICMPYVPTAISHVPPLLVQQTVLQRCFCCSMRKPRTIW